MSDSCRICLEQDSAKKLITPCACAGTQKFVHRDCLAKWQKVIMDGSLLNPDNYNIDKARVCSVCKTTYSLAPPTPSLYDSLIKSVKYFLAFSLGVLCMVNTYTPLKYKILASCIVLFSLYYLPLLISLLITTALPILICYLKGIRLSYVMVTIYLELGWQKTCIYSSR